jgi:tRNA 2-thiouridine synthesizing protein E
MRRLHLTFRYGFRASPAYKGDGMKQVTQDFGRPCFLMPRNPAFPHAPFDWSREVAEAMARRECLALTPAHWRGVWALQECCARHEDSPLNPRELDHALDEHLHGEGGIEYLDTLFPKAPVVQGCRLAGLRLRSGVRDRGFGSAV